MNQIVESGSSLGTFRTCRQKHKYEYIEMLQSRGYSSALNFGTLVHWLVEQNNKKRDFTKKEYYDFANAQKMAHWDEQTMADFHFDVGLAERIVPIWHKYWTEHDGELSQKALKFRTVEGEWAFGIAENHIHVGKRDGDFVHESYGKPFLYELKTASSSEGEDYLTRLALDHQISSNVLALKAEGVEVAGTLYDVIYKHALRQKKEESATAFLERITKDYEDHKAEYFQRVLVPRTPKKLREYMGELQATFKDVESGVVYRNTSACKQFNKLCPYWQLCMDDDSPEIRQLFVKKERKFNELEKANSL